MSADDFYCYACNTCIEELCGCPRATDRAAIRLEMLREVVRRMAIDPKVTSLPSVFAELDRMIAEEEAKS